MSAHLDANPTTDAASDVALSPLAWPSDDAAFLAALVRDDGVAKDVPSYALLTARSLYDAAFDKSVVGGLRAFLEMSQSNEHGCARRLVMTVLDRCCALGGLAADSDRMIRDIVEAHLEELREPLLPVVWRRMRIEAMSLADSQPATVDKVVLEIASALAWRTPVAAGSVHETIRLLVGAETDSAAMDAKIVRVEAGDILGMNRRFRQEAAPEKPTSAQFWAWLETTEPTMSRDYAAQEAFLADKRCESVKSLLAQVNASADVSR